MVSYILIFQEIVIVNFKLKLFHLMNAVQIRWKKQLFNFILRELQLQKLPILLIKCMATITRHKPFQISPQESLVVWEELLLNTKEYRLKDVLYHLFLNAKQQRCLVHMARNIYGQMRHQELLSI